MFTSLISNVYFHHNLLRPQLKTWIGHHNPTRTFHFTNSTSNLFETPDIEELIKFKCSMVQNYGDSVVEFSSFLKLSASLPLVNLCLKIFVKTSIFFEKKNWNFQFWECLRLAGLSCGSFSTKTVLLHLSQNYWNV